MSQDHPHVDTIKRYYHGCNTVDAALIKSTFTEDVVHYFTHHKPVRGADTLPFEVFGSEVHGKMRHLAVGSGSWLISD